MQFNLQSSTFYLEKFFLRVFLSANLFAKSLKLRDFAISCSNDIIPNADSLSLDIVDRKTFFIIFKLLKLLSALATVTGVVSKIRNTIAIFE